MPKQFQIGSDLIPIDTNLSFGTSERRWIIMPSCVPFSFISLQIPEAGSEETTPAYGLTASHQLVSYEFENGSCPEDITILWTSGSISITNNGTTSPSEEIILCFMCPIT